jgi:hypothetical protein
MAGPRGFRGAWNAACEHFGRPKGDPTMNTFEMRVRAAASAGGYTLLATAAVIVVQWLAALVLFATRPAWVLDAIGHLSTWDELAHLWLSLVAGLKFFFWVEAAIVLWTALWAWRLRKYAQVRTSSTTSARGEIEPQRVPAQTGAPHPA